MPLEITFLPLKYILAIAYAASMLTRIDIVDTVNETNILFIRFFTNLVFKNNVEYPDHTTFRGKNVGTIANISSELFIDVINVQYIGNSATVKKTINSKQSTTLNDFFCIFTRISPNLPPKFSL